MRNVLLINVAHLLLNVVGQTSACRLIGMQQIDSRQYVGMYGLSALCMVEQLMRAVGHSRNTLFGHQC
jgi:hypothetical protein